MGPPSVAAVAAVARTNTVAAHSAGPAQGLKRAFEGISPLSCSFLYIFHQKASEYTLSMSELLSCRL
jgi:hypothetical protein